MSSKKAARRQAAAEQRLRQRRMTYVIAGVAAVLVLAAMFWFDARSRALPPVLQGRVEEYPSEGAAHVPLGQRVTYRTDPPNSGPHYDRWAPPGFYTQPIVDELLVHNLEHGHIIIFYRPGELSPEDEAYLLTLTRTYTGDWDAVLAVPRPGMAHPFTLAAWRRLLRLETLEKEAVEAFIDAYRGRGPENPVR